MNKLYTENTLDKHGVPKADILTVIDVDKKWESRISLESLHNFYRLREYLQARERHDRPLSY